MTMYAERFEKIHMLLKEYGCKPTYSFHPEYQCPMVFGGNFFYRSEGEMHLDRRTTNNWEEKVDAGLDVTIPTSIREADKKEIRFDMEWSNKAKLYSMYISLPTSSRSKPLSHKRFKTQDEVIKEILFWLNKAGCKRQTEKEPKQKVVAGRQYEQMGLF